MRQHSALARTSMKTHASLSILHSRVQSVSQRLIPNQEEDIELLDDNKGKDEVGITGVDTISTAQEPSCIDSRRAKD